MDDDTTLLHVFPRKIQFRLVQVTVTACDFAEVALDLTLVKKVKGKCPQTQALVMTVHGDEECERRIGQAGGVGVQKPFDRHRFIGAVNVFYRSTEAEVECASGSISPMSSQSLLKPYRI